MPGCVHRNIGLHKQEQRSVNRKAFVHLCTLSEVIIELYCIVLYYNRDWLTGSVVVLIVRFIHAWTATSPEMKWSPLLYRSTVTSGNYTRRAHQSQTIVDLHQLQQPSQFSNITSSGMLCPFRNPQLSPRVLWRVSFSSRQGSDRELFAQCAKVILQPVQPRISRLLIGIFAVRGSQVDGVLGCQPRGRGFKSPPGQKIFHTRGCQWGHE